MKTPLVFLVTFVCFVLSAQQNKHVLLTSQEKSALLNAIDNDTVFASWVGDTSYAMKLYKQYKANVKHSDSLWESDQKRLQKISDFGYTRTFELIPLVEHLYGDPDFKIGMGVSYLIRTDNSTILFDTGIDDDSTMCVLRYNLDKLGIDISEIDAIIISHNHGDHQNDWKWIRDRTFVNNEKENILSGLKIYIPEDTLDLKVETICSHDPVKISEGVYTTGIIKAPMFLYSTQEQGIMVNVKDKGIIIVTGCGHQTIEKLIERFERLSDMPLYGILGGLHYPVDGDSETYYGYFVTGKLPWESFTVTDVNKKIEFIKQQNVKLLGVSTHDSSGRTIEAFKTSFPLEYKDLRTGEWIVVK